MRRAIIFAAVAAYLMVLGCVVWQNSAGGAHSAHAAEQPVANLPQAGIGEGSLPFRGIVLQIQRVDWMEEYKHAIDEIAEVGADTVKFVVDARQENGKAGRIYLDMRMTPTQEQLSSLIRHAKSKNLRVILMPIVLLDAPQGNEWRGTIQPESWEEWFDSYRAMLMHFATISQTNGVDLLVVGSGLVSSESRLEEWTKTIREVRKVYKGLLTYSSNWDHYTSVPFWNQLDLIGMNSYWKLDRGKKSAATVEDIQAAWKDIQSDLIPFARKMNKPILFLEVGWCSMNNAAHEPWDYTTGDPVDVDLQKRLYEGFFRSWHGSRYLGGFNIWSWSIVDGEENARGYSPKDKPAEKVLREWLAKPRWKVDAQS